MKRLTLVALIGLASGACDGRLPIDSDETDTDTDTDSDTDTDTDTDTDSDTDTDTDTDTDPMSCSDGPPSTGPWAVDGSAPAHPISAAGAVASATAYTNDAGVGALRTATTGSTDAVVSLAISGAIVTAVDYVPAPPNDGTATFWFADSGGAMQAFRLNLGGVEPSTLKPGDAVSFTATLVTDYFNTLEVKEATGFTIDSSGNGVYVIDGMASALSPSTQLMQNVEVYGELTDDPTECGTGKDCFTLAYGFNTTVFRTGAGFQQKGDCIHWIGPLGEFSSAPQLNAGNFDWYRWY